MVDWHLYLAALHTKIQLKWQWNIISSPQGKDGHPPKMWFRCGHWWFYTHTCTHTHTRQEGMKRIFAHIMRHSEKAKVASKWFENGLRGQEKETDCEFLLWSRGRAGSSFPHLSRTSPQWQRREHSGFLTCLPRWGPKGKREECGFQAVRKHFKKLSLHYMTEIKTYST